MTNLFPGKPHSPNRLELEEIPLSASDIGDLTIRAYYGGFYNDIEDTNLLREIFAHAAANTQVPAVKPLQSISLKK